VVADTISLERHSEAAAATRDALVQLAPFVDAHPEAFRGLVTALARDHKEASEQSGIGPDADLLQRVANSIGSTEPSVDPQQLPETIIRQIVADPQAQDMLRKVMSDNDLQGAPSDLPPEAQRAIVGALISAGVIHIGDTSHEEAT
jgi:hypothetical protein